jgi:hypothetical protein
MPMLQGMYELTDVEKVNKPFSNCYAWEQAMGGELVTPRSGCQSSTDARSSLESSLSTRDPRLSNFLIEELDRSV